MLFDLLGQLKPAAVSVAFVVLLLRPPPTSPTMLSLVTSPSAMVFSGIKVSESLAWSNSGFVASFVAVFAQHLPFLRWAPYFLLLMKCPLQWTQVNPADILNSFFFQGSMPDWPSTEWMWVKVKVDFHFLALTRHKVSLLGIISAKWLWCFFMSIFTLMKMNVTHWQNITRNMVCNSQSGFGQLAKQAWGWVSQLQCFWSGMINAKTKISPISTLWGWWTDLLSLLGCEVRIRKGTESGLHRRRGVV